MNEYQNRQKESNLNSQHDLPLIVLEAGATHLGNLETAIALIDSAAMVPEVSAIKFQTVWAGNMASHRPGHLTYRDADGEHSRLIVDMLRERELDWDTWDAIDLHALEVGIPWFSTPDIPSTAKMLGNCQTGYPTDRFHLCAIKIAGMDMGRVDLIDAAANTGLQVLLDTRGGKEDLDTALEICGRHRPDAIIVHTPTGYPTVDPGLSRISDLVDEYPDHLIGFTSHSTGHLDCVKAIEAGASYIEKGITLDRKQPGIEHLMCIEPVEVAGFVDQILQAHQAKQGAAK